MMWLFRVVISVAVAGRVSGFGPAQLARITFYNDTGCKTLGGAAGELGVLE
jgi:hypothetical protein